MDPLLTIHSLVSAVPGDPITVDETRQHLRFPTTSEDWVIKSYITAARQYFEEQTGRQLITATWDLLLNGAPSGELELPHPPLRSVVSVTYDDLSLSPVEQTMSADNYTVIAPSGPTCPRGRIVLASGASWPTPASTGANALRIRYTAGYGDTAKDVPELIRVALFLLVGLFHKYRAEGQDGTVSPLPLGADQIVKAFKYTAYPTLALSRAV